MMIKYLLTLLRGAAVKAPDAPEGVEFYDRRKYAAQAHGPKRDWKVKSRPWKRVTGTCLHQTACILGERVERYDNVGAHICITRGGKVIWLHDFNREVAHGNLWNAQTVGIEIDGLYAGIEGNLSTVWDDPSTKHREMPVTLTPAAIEAAKQTIRWIHARVDLNGGNHRALVAHRQSSKSRQNDPGSAIWQEVALPLHAELGLSDGGPGFEIGGRPIPEVWDPSRKGYKY
jgi:hypothetical protein